MGGAVPQGGRSRRSPRSAATMACSAWSAWKTANGAPIFRPRGRSVSSTDERAVFCRARAARQATARRFRARCADTTATGRHIPSGVENPLPPTPISGTNRFELRGILRVGILDRDRVAEGDECMVGKRVFGHSSELLSAIVGLGVASSAQAQAGRRRAARLADGLSAGLHAADGEGRIAARPAAGDHHADLASSCWRCCSTWCGASTPRAIPCRRTTTHNTVLEIAWTIIPILILVVIAIPSFRLLYYGDKAHGCRL